MPSSFFKRSPLKVVTPCKYSMGLFNMVAGELTGFVFTNIQCRPLVFYRLHKIIKLKDVRLSLSKPVLFFTTRLRQAQADSFLICLT